MLLIMSTGIVGLVIARNISLRPQQIRHIKSGLQMLETEMLYGLTPLPQALKRVGARIASPINLLFITSSQYLERGEGITAGEADEPHP